MSEANRKAAMNSRDKATSVQRSFEQYEMKLALLQTWENDPKADPAYILELQKKVRYYHGQLVNKGAICPNET